MKKLFLIVSIVVAAVLVLSMTQVYADSDPDGTGKKRPPDSEVTPTPDRQATAKAKQQTNPGSVQPTLNAQRQATAHPEQDKTNNAGGNTFVGKPKNFKGEIVSVDATSIVISQRGGVLLTIYLSGETMIRIPGQKTNGLNPANSLLIGMDVSVKALPAKDGSLIASRISVIP